jgi:hypothetical protein
MKVMVFRDMTPCNLRDRLKRLLFPSAGQGSNIIFVIIVIIIINFKALFFIIIFFSVMNMLLS